MFLDLTRYRRPLESFSRTFAPTDVGEPDDAYKVVEPVDLAFEVHKDKDKFRLVGTVKGALELMCSRCVEPFRLAVDAPFDIRYLPATEASSEQEREIEEEDLETSYYRDDRIDLNELIREQFYLSLPMKPLCQDACKGLCVQCGKNLNTGPCDCAPAWNDPRLAGLRALKRES
jgi:uncharacterized protein